MMFCPYCEDYQDVRIENQKETYTVYGEKVSISLDVSVCVKCGKTISTNDQAVVDAVNAAYRKQKQI